MSKYFSNFPKILYSGLLATDITKRNRVVESLLSNPFIFLPYTVKEGEKPEDIAYYYYGSVNDTWMVLLANKMLDPYTDWTMDEESFTKYFIKKYESYSNHTGFDVIRWGANNLEETNIVYYCRFSDSSENKLLKLSPESYQTLYLRKEDETIILTETGERIVIRSTDLPGWTPVRIFEYERQLNENKREILLIDKAYKNQFRSQFEKALKLT